MFGHGHEAYRELVAELGMEVQPSYVADPGEMTWGLVDGVLVGDQPPWMSDRELADLARVERAFATLAQGVDPDDPWAHPQAAALDATSLGEWLRSEGALEAVRRRYELASLSLSCDGPERTSLLAELRKHAALGGERFYDLEQWEGLRVSEGSAAVALRMAAQLGARVRLNSVVRRIAVKPGRVRVTLADGELVEAEAVVCAIPAGPLREIEISGVSDARLASLRALRHALAAKVVVSYDSPFWQDNGQNGLAETEWLFGSTWPQGPGVLSLLVPPERLSAFLAAPAPARAEAVLDGLARLVRRACARARGAARAGLGSGPVHARLHHELGARGPGPRGARCTEPTSRRSTWPAQTTGSPATWRARCALGEPPHGRRSARARRSERRSRRPAIRPARASPQARRRPRGGRARSRPPSRRSAS